MRDDRPRGRRVYSTEIGRSESSGEPPAPRPMPGDGVVRVRREVAGRRGKPVTTIEGVPLAGKELAALAGELKRRCGAGGSVKEGTIEIQGDHRERVVEMLIARGYRVKLAGG